jgi:ABC-type dipeptide/oligopeptide/nickel transport system permease subunit
MRRFWSALGGRPVALASFIVLCVLYLGMIFCEFLAPYSPTEQFVGHSSQPPNLLVYSRPLGLRPQVQTMAMIDEITRQYVRVEGEYTPVKLLAVGPAVKMWGFFPLQRHLFGTGFFANPSGGDAPVFVFGTDNLGRDIFSRLLYGARISLTIGFVGVAISLLIALVLGGLAGYLGGFWDWIIMRFAEFIILIPGLYLILFLRSILSTNLNSGQSYMLITVILSFVGWPGTARMIRGMVHAIKRNDFVANAELESMPSMAILFRHVIPQMASILIVGVTLGIPGFILGETVLSYLGLGIVDPAVSWGSMISRDTTTISNLVSFPWLLTPGVALILVAVSFNFLGELLRDVQDPNWRARRRAAVRRSPLSRHGDDPEPRHG